MFFRDTWRAGIREMGESTGNGLDAAQLERVLMAWPGGGSWRRGLLWVGERAGAVLRPRFCGSSPRLKSCVVTSEERQV